MAKGKAESSNKATEPQTDKEKKPDEVTEPQEDELTEEDKQLKEALAMLVERITELDTSLHRPALEQLRTQIRTSTSSMTSVPKPLKFLREHYDTLKTAYANWPDGQNRKFLADVISVLAMTNVEGHESLEYRLKGSQEPLESWGHEYVRHLAGEISREYADRTTASATAEVDDLVLLAQEIVPYNMNHNAEAEACDLLMEVERLDLLDKHVDEASYPRVCLYLTSCVNYVPEPEDSMLLRTALAIYQKFNRPADAMVLAIRLNDMDLVQEIFTTCEDLSVQKQLAFMLGRQQICFDLDPSMSNRDDLTEIMENVPLNNHFLSLARELDIMEPKVPEDIYKSHLETHRSSYGPSNVDSAKQNLAASFVNGFLNCAFGRDKLLMDDGSKWIYKNKDHGMMSATASLGLILLWDVDTGLSQIDKYLYATDDFIKSGALLACGIVNCGVKNECDPALAILSDYVLHNTHIMRIGAIVGLGLAYAGSARDEIIDLLLPVLSDEKSLMECVGMTALALGMIGVSTCHAEITAIILQTMMERSEEQLKDPFAKYLALGLGLTYLGKQDAAEVVVASLEVVPDPLGTLSRVMVEVCAYAGTGNVLKVQNLLHTCSEHYETEKDQEKESGKQKQESGHQHGSGSGTPNSGSEASTKPVQDATHQAMAVLGIALIAGGEEIGAQMAMRSFSHLLQYGEPVIRRAIPLALGLLSTSNPQLNVLDMLSKLSHDTDAEVSHNAIFGLGLVGAGTNNARLAGMLRQLAMYYHKDANNLFMTRIAQGLTHAGKGTLTMNPYHHDRTLVSRVALGGLLSVLVACLDVKKMILGKSHHYLLYYLVPAIQPRMLVTLDEDLKSVSVTVRVGQAVDVVGQAGKPKTITGFQTHSTPVLLAYGERAELATEEYVSLSPIMEGLVILKKVHESS